MSRIWHEIRWTRKEVEQFKKTAIRKRMEADAALQAAVDIEVEYWNQMLAKKFPELKDEFRGNFVDYKRDYFYCKVAFSDGPAECIIGLPEKQWGGTIHDYHTVIKVWHKRADGKRYRRDCLTYRCDEILPFVSDIVPLPPRTKPSAESAVEDAVKEAVSDS